MGTLDALLDEKLGVLAEEKAAKQANKNRLIADPNISVSSLMESIGNFLRYKKTKDLWALLGPPAGAAASYGWHSLPNGEWLVKVSSLLFELLGVASNSKIQSKKLHKALVAMHQQRELDVRTWAGHTSNDAIDRLDFTIRVLMSMLRQLRTSGSLKTKVLRSLPRRDQVCLDLVLQKVPSCHKNSWSAATSLSMKMTKRLVRFVPIPVHLSVWLWFLTSTLRAPRTPPRLTREHLQA